MAGQNHAEAALLSLRIIDVACGSGHRLLGAARRVGKELARLRNEVRAYLDVFGARAT